MKIRFAPIINYIYMHMNYIQLQLHHVEFLISQHCNFRINCVSINLYDICNNRQTLFQ